MAEIEICNACIVVKKAFENVIVTNMDLRLVTMLTQFKTNFTKIMKVRLDEMGIKNFIVRVGYGLITRHVIEDFTECLTEEQWSIGCEKILSTNAYLVIIVNESFVCSINEMKKLRSYDNSTLPEMPPMKRNRQNPLSLAGNDEQSRTCVTPLVDFSVPIHEENITFAENQSSGIDHLPSPVTEINQQSKIGEANPLENLSLPIYEENIVLPENPSSISDINFEDTVPIGMTFENEIVMDTYDNTVDVYVSKYQDESMNNDDRSVELSRSLVTETCGNFEDIELQERTTFTMPLEQVPSCSNIEASERFKKAVGDLWFSQANDVVIKLQRLIEKGYLPTDHILYLILNDMISFVDVMYSSDESAKTNWQWSDVVKDFFSTIRKTGGKRTFNLLRGPGNFQQGSIHKNFDIKNYNLPLPHLKTLRRQQSGYTTRSGIYLPYITGFIEKSAREANSILRHEENVMQIFVCRGVDGFGLKAGCNRDQRTNELIGMDFVLDIKWINDHPEPDIQYLKNHLIREAEPEVLTTLDGKISFPVGVNYLSEKIGHEQVVENWKSSISILETCLNCLKNLTLNDSVIMDTENEKICSIYCTFCASSGNVCETCATLGYTEVMVDKRKCTRCIENGVKCVRLKCGFTASDCGSPYKKAMVVYNGDMDYLSGVYMNPSDSVLKPTGAIPDIVHICKCLCCSLQNWFLICDETRINLGMLRVIREKDSAHGEALRRILPLDSLRKRDRMNSKHPLNVSSNELWSKFYCNSVCPSCMLLDGKTLCAGCADCQAVCKKTVVLVPLVPEKWRLSKDNYENVIKSPLSICEGSPGIYYISNPEKIVSMRLHYPVEITPVISGLKKCSAIGTFDGILILSEIDSSEISYVDCAKKLVPKAPTRKAEIISFLTKEGVDFDPRAKVTELKKILQDEMRVIKEASSTKRKLVDLRMATALCVYGDLLFVTATIDGITCIVQMGLEKSTKVQVIEQKNFELPHSSLLLSMTFSNNGIVYIDGYAKSSISLLNLESGQVLDYHIQTEPDVEHQLHGITKSSTEMFFVSCTNQRRVYKVSFFQDTKTIVLDQYCGNGDISRKYGFGSEASFVQPTALCTEGKSIIVLDTGASSVSLISELYPLWKFVNNVRIGYNAFDIHEKSTKKKTFLSALPLLEEFDEGISSIAAAVAKNFDIEMSRLNGSWGSVSIETVNSIGILKNRIAKFCKMYRTLSNVCLSKSITTIVNEHMNACSRAHAQNAAVDTLSYAISFPNVVEDAMKRISSLPYHYFTSEKRHYEKPDDVAPFDLPKLPHLVLNKLSMEDLIRLLEFRKKYVEPVRVGTVRADTTKDKFSTIPIALYGEREPDINEVDIFNFLTSKDSLVDQSCVIYPEHSVFSVQIDDTYCVAITTIDIREKSTSKISCDIFKSSFSSTTPMMEFYERTKTKYSNFKRHYGLFEELFGSSYECNDSIEIDEAFYEAMFINQNFDDDFEDEDDSSESLDTYGETSSISSTRTRNTRAPSKFR